jgi:hypothetical protein
VSELNPFESLLQRITAITLWAVMLALAWMVSAAYLPDSFRMFSVEVEIVIILVLLVTALVLVSVVALRHTRLPPV